MFALRVLNTMLAGIEARVMSMFLGVQRVELVPSVVFLFLCICHYLVRVDAISS